MAKRLQSSKIARKSVKGISRKKLEATKAIKLPPKLSATEGLDLDSNDTRAFTFVRREIKKNDIIENRPISPSKKGHLWTLFWAIAPRKSLISFGIFFVLLIIPLICLIFFFL